MFCGKDSWKNVLVLSTKISKKVGVPSVGRRKSPCPHIITLYSHCGGGAICNDQRSLPLTTGGLEVLQAPQQVQGRTLVGVLEEKLLEALKPLHFVGSERV